MKLTQILTKKISLSNAFCQKTAGFKSIIKSQTKDKIEQK